MRRLLTLGLAVALIESISLPARADLFKNFKTDGSFETRSYSITNALTRNPNANDYSAGTNYRAMAGGTFDVLDDVHGRLLLNWNNNTPGNNGAAQGQGGTTGGSISSLEANTLIQNAYVKVDKVFGHVDLTIGRQFYGDSNDLVIYYGPNGDSLLSVASLDTFRADADILGWAHFQGIAGKIADNGLQAVGNNSDTDIWGGELNSDKVIPAGNLAAYYYTAQTKKDANALPGNNTLIVYGARANGDIKPVGGLGYNAELIQDGGRNNGAANTPGYGGSAYSLGLKYGRDLASMPFRAAIDYARGSDNFVAINPGRRYGIIWGEFTNQAGDPSLQNGVGGAGISNLKVFDGKLGINPLAKLGVDLSAYRFMYSSTGGANLAPATSNGRTSAGTEYDLVVSWKHSDNVSFDVNAATLQVGDALQNAPGTPTSPVTQLGADVKIKF